MKLTSILAATAMTGAPLASPLAQAQTLLNSVNLPDQTSTPYSLTFTAASSVTKISIGGYQIVDFEVVSNIGLYQNNAGGNLLGGSWVLTPAAPLFSNAYSYNDGTSVHALVFGSTAQGAYDTYAQAIATTAGKSYSLDFQYTNDVFGGGSGPSGLLVNTAVPEASTWTLMLLGFAGLGFLSRRQTKPSPAAIA